MKRMNKLIGTALLSTVIGLASCTEEYDLPQQAGFAGERPLAGHVSLNVATPSSEADTRLAYEPGAGYRFEAGDSLAACLMDVVASTDTAASWYERYHLTDVVTESAAFTLDAEGSWTTASTLREGNYFFLYPYKPGQKAGGACTFSLSGQTQTGTSRESLTRAFAENNLYVGYAPIVTDSTREGYGVDVELRPVFGALGIRVYNNARQACHVRSLTLRLPGGGFPTTVAINPTACGYATKDGTFNIAQYVGDNSPEGVEAGYDVAFTDYSRRKAIRDLVKPLPASEAAETVRLTVEEAEALKRQASQDFLVMLPEGTYTDLLLDIETDEGLIHHLPLSGETVISTAKGALREVRFTEDDFSPLPEVNASSTLDVEYLIRWNVNTETMLTAHLNDNIRITSKMYDMLRDGKSTGLTINLNGHSVVIDKDVDATAMSGKLFFSDAAEREGRIIVLGEQRLSEGIPATVRNEGKLVLSGGEGYSIESPGVTEVQGKVAQCVLTGNGLLDITQGAELSGEISSPENGVILNHGKLDGLKLNGGKLTNYGEVSGDGASLNTGTVYNEGGRCFIGINQGEIHAAGYGATVVQDNADGRIFITGLENDGNILVGDSGKQGAIIQELYGDVTTDKADSRANTLWIDAILSGAKDAKGEAQDIDLSAYTVTAAGPAARIENGGKEMKFASLQVLAGATLYIAHASVDTPSVSMEGDATGKAGLFISNRGNLYNDTGATVINGTGEAYNTVSNYGGHNTRIVVNGATEM